MVSNEGDRTGTPIRDSPTSGLAFYKLARNPEFRGLVKPDARSPAVHRSYSLTKHNGRTAKFLLWCSSRLMHGAQALCMSCEWIMSFVIRITCLSLSPICFKSFSPRNLFSFRCSMIYCALEEQVGHNGGRVRRREYNYDGQSTSPPRLLSFEFVTVLVRLRASSAGRRRCLRSGHPRFAVPADS